MANNVIDAAIRLRDLFTPTVRSVNASLGTMKTQMVTAKQSVSGLSDKMALLSAPIMAAATEASSCTATLQMASPRFRLWSTR